MPRKIISKTVLLFAVVAICMMIGAIYYEKIALREQNRDVNLFSLVPEDCGAVMEVKDVRNFFDKLETSSYYPCFMESESSQLIRLLYRNIGLLSEQKTHGLSARVNRLLLSFHAPGTGRDQVVYGCMNSDDHHALRKVFEQSGIQKDYAKETKYKGESIWIVPLNNEEFLSCFVHKEFFVMSFQKSLVEKVVDTYLEDTPSLLKDSLIKQLTYSHRKSQHSTFLYMRARPFCAWADLNVRLHDRVIYMIGEGHAGEGENTKSTKTGPIHNNAFSILADSVWASTLYRGTKVHLDGERLLPEKTVLYGLCAIDHPEVLPLSLGASGTNGTYTLMDYLKEKSMGEVQWTRFEDEDSGPLLCVAALPLRPDVTPYDAKWNSLCTAPSEWKSIEERSSYLRCTLNVEGQEMQATVWNNHLLLSNSGWRSLERYIRAVEHGEARETLFCEEDADMFQDFNLTVYGNLESLLKYPALFRGPLTQSLFQNKDLFSHFTSSVQLLSSDDHYYINLLFTHAN